MSPFLRRAATVAVLAVAGALLAAPPAGADVQNSTLTIASEPGEPVGGGATYSYAQSAGDLFFVGTDNSGTGAPVPSVVGIDVNRPDGSGSWRITLHSARGQTLVPGEYPDATRAGTDSSRNGIYVQRDGVGCGFPTGSFTVLEAVYGDYAYVQTFHATFVQQCVPGGPVLRGEVRVDDGPPPPPLEFGVTVDPRGTLPPHGQPTVSGTVTCNIASYLTIRGTVGQVAGRSAAIDDLTGEVVCAPGAPVRWQVTGTSVSGPGFKVGNAEVRATVSGTDPLTGGQVTVDAAATVRLARR